MTKDDELEILFDTAGPPSQSEVIELASQIAAGVVLIWYSVTELMAQLRRRKRILHAVPHKDH